MKRHSLVGFVSVVLFLTACGSSGGGGGDTTVDKAMIDAIQAYTKVIYQADSASLPSVVCQQDLSALQKQMEQAAKPPTTSEKTYDLSDVVFKVDKRNGDVVKLGIVSGKLKIKSATNTLDNMPIPGSAGGIILKNESGWKVCYGAQP